MKTIFGIPGAFLMFVVAALFTGLVTLVVNMLVGAVAGTNMLWTIISMVLGLTVLTMTYEAIKNMRMGKAVFSLNALLRLFVAQIIVGIVALVVVLVGGAVALLGIIDLTSATGLMVMAVSAVLLWAVMLYLEWALYERLRKLI
jgi:hypothetical protein